MSENKCGLNPFGKQVVVEPAEVEEKSLGGIIMPATSENKSVRGTVAAVGPGEDKPLQVKVGSKVLFRKYAGTEFEHKGKTYLVLREDELIGEII